MALKETPAELPGSARFLAARRVQILSALDTYGLVNVGRSVSEVAQGREIALGKLPLGLGSEHTEVICGFVPNAKSIVKEYWTKPKFALSEPDTITVLLGFPPPSPGEYPERQSDSALTVYIPDEAEPPSMSVRRELSERGVATFPPRKRSECYLGAPSQANTRWTCAARNIEEIPEIPFPGELQLTLGLLHRLITPSSLVDAPTSTEIESTVLGIAQSDFSSFEAEAEAVLNSSLNLPNPTRKVFSSRTRPASLVQALGVVSAFKPKALAQSPTSALTSFLFPSGPSHATRAPS